MPKYRVTIYEMKEIEVEARDGDHLSDILYNEMNVAEVVDIEEIPAEAAS